MKFTNFITSVGFWIFLLLVKTASVQERALISITTTGLETVSADSLEAIFAHKKNPSVYPYGDVRVLSFSIGWTSIYFRFTGLGTNTSVGA